MTCHTNEKIEKLTTVENLEIIAFFEASEGQRQYDLAKKLQIPESTLSRIKNN